MCEGSGGGGGGVGICVSMNSVCTPSGGTAPGVGRVGMNLISSLPCTTTGEVLVVSGGDVRVVGNGDVLGDVGGRYHRSSWMGTEMCWHGQTYGMDPHHCVPRSLCHKQCPNTSHLLSDLLPPWCGDARVCGVD